MSLKLYLIEKQIQNFIRRDLSVFSSKNVYRQLIRSVTFQLPINPDVEKPNDPQKFDKKEIPGVMNVIPGILKEKKEKPEDESGGTQAQKEQQPITTVTDIKNKNPNDELPKTFINDGELKGVPDREDAFKDDKISEFEMAEEASRHGKEAFEEARKHGKPESHHDSKILAKVEETAKKIGHKVSEGASKLADKIKVTAVNMAGGEEAVEDIAKITKQTAEEAKERAKDATEQDKNKYKETKPGSVDPNVASKQ